MKSSNTQATQSQIVSALLAIFVIIGATAFTWYWIQKQSVAPEESQALDPATTEETPAPTPTPTPTKLIHGKDTYSVSGGGGNGPLVSEITFDPLDPEVGAKQTISVKLSGISAVTSAQVNVRTDTKTTTVQLTRINGTELGGTWEGTWTIPETYLYNYIPTIVAKSSTGETTIPITIRERK